MHDEVYRPPHYECEHIGSLTEEAHDLISDLECARHIVVPAKPGPDLALLPQHHSTGTALDEIVLLETDQKKKMA